MRRLFMSFCVAVCLLFMPDQQLHDNQAYASVINTTGASQKDDQIKCLADTIFYESKGEVGTGKVAVAFVTINRTKNESFPDTICGVVKQKTNKRYQYSWYRVKKKPVDKSEKDLYNDVKDVAEYVYNNYRYMKDPTNGALYFHAKHVKVKRKGKVVKAIIGNHIFYDIKTKNKQKA